MVLDLLSLLFLGYDLVVTPYIIAWQQPWEGMTGFWDGNGQLEMGTLVSPPYHMNGAHFSEAANHREIVSRIRGGTV
eukprot:5398640-Amphidinium_carterae.1